jgi:DNA transposition AAA+ family ATPase
VGPWEFIVTKQHRRFVEFCDACRRYRYIGLCYGPPGVGKTLSARQYAHWDLIEPIFPRYLFELPPTARDLRTVLYTPTVANTPGQIAREVELACRSLDLAIRDSTHPRDPDEPVPWSDPPECTELLIVDEADRLKMQGLEQMRDIYDRKGIGLILIGMPGIEKRLARYPQLYSRVGFVHQYRPLSDEEIRFILEYKWQQLGLELKPEDFTDAEAVATILRITGGNFRLIHRLFTQIERVLQINEMRTVTKEVVEAARENLVIGIV